MPHRDRGARRAGRQAGPVHRRLRRADLLRVHAGRHGSASARWRSTNATLHDLEEHLLLFFTGYARSAGESSPIRTRARAPATRRCSTTSTTTKSLGLRDQGACSSAATRGAFGELMNEHWRAQAKALAGDLERRHRPLVRAGSRPGRSAASSSAPARGGFLLFYAAEPRQVRAGDGRGGPGETRFSFDLDGSVVLVRE